MLEPCVLLLAPYAPHVAEELWRRSVRADALSVRPWPKFDAELAKEDEIETPASRFGRRKVKARLRVSPDIDDKALEATALADPTVQAEIAGKTVKMVRVVPKKLVNVVLGWLACLREPTRKEDGRPSPAPCGRGSPSHRSLKGHHARSRSAPKTTFPWPAGTVRSRSEH